MSPFELVKDDEGYRYTRWEKFRKWLGFHVHTKKLFVMCDGKIALVKCTGCSQESLPWEVPLRLQEWAREAHRDDIKEYVKIEERLRNAPARTPSQRP